MWPSQKSMLENWHWHGRAKWKTLLLSHPLSCSACMKGRTWEAFGFGLILKSCEILLWFFKWKRHQHSKFFKKHTQNYLGPNPSIKTFIKTFSSGIHSAQHNSDFGTVKCPVWLRLLLDSSQTAWLSLSMAAKCLPCPAVVGGHLRSSHTGGKGPVVPLRHRSLHLSAQRKMMAFSISALGCELRRVRGTYPAGSSVAGDLWQGYIWLWW